MHIMFIKHVKEARSQLMYKKEDLAALRNQALTSLDLEVLPTDFVLIDVEGCVKYLLVQS